MTARSSAGLALAQRAIDTPIGPMGLAVGPDGLCFVDLTPDPAQGDEGVSAEADDIAGQFLEYLEGRRRRFDVRLDWSVTRPGFRRTVLQELITTDYGETLTYGELAARAGSPGAARAVGTAMSTNPFGIVVPCHRVLAAGGRIGGYGGGLDRKRYLLALEAAASLTR